MNSTEIRQKFFDFFESKGHKIVPSSPIVNRQDPTLLFTNAGMNQFKDYFLGNKKPEQRRLADTQKCLRASGKHNDLEEVGIDSYHHTMFEMLGNWSIGDYFKAEAIEWAWELLTEEYRLPKERLYASVFEGDQEDGLEADEEAKNLWMKYLPEDRILYFDKKDNFWEMGEQGPCGPCSEIHIDLRSDEERKKIDGKTLVNADHPLVIEIWNLVFIQYNKKADGSLEKLPEKHVDTGMGFERLCMAIQQKKSNYDTDVFVQFFEKIEEITGVKYSGSYALDSKSDISFRVIVDHLRAVSFGIADGELPSNTGAGYVLRRILRRAVRYYYSFLDRRAPTLYLLVDDLAEYFENVFPEVYDQREFIKKVILEEEKSFLKTLADGLKRLEPLLLSQKAIDGKTAFELYDTYGFPIDLTQLIAGEKGIKVDMTGFHTALNEQKQRGKKDAKKSTGDWVELNQGETEFIGYDHTEWDKSKVLKYREIEAKGKKEYQIVLDQTPFYGESGGQVGDTGKLIFGEEEIRVLDTQKENELIIHMVNKIPQNPDRKVKTIVDADKRKLIQNNHTATHLLHAALRTTLGNHVAQKGSLVNHKYLRFDFSHFEKITKDELSKIEALVNQKIRENIGKKEQRSVALSEAKSSGATMLFGEKYGDIVRIITFDDSYSKELCGGCHVEQTGEIGLFKIKSEGSVASGVRRIEALTSYAADEYVNEHFYELEQINTTLKNPQNTLSAVQALINENQELNRIVEEYKNIQTNQWREKLINEFQNKNGLQILVKPLANIDTKTAKNLIHQLGNSKENSIILFGLKTENKANLMLFIHKDVVSSKQLNANDIIKKLSPYIKGGGGGQPFFAVAGGSHPSGIDEALDRFDDVLSLFN